MALFTVQVRQTEIYEAKVEAESQEEANATIDEILQSGETDEGEEWDDFLTSTGHLELERI